MTSRWLNSLWGSTHNSIVAQVRNLAPVWLRNLAALESTSASMQGYWVILAQGVLLSPGQNGPKAAIRWVGILDEPSRLGVPPYTGYIGMCGPKGYGFLAVLFINRVSILAVLVINRVWFLHSSLELLCFFLEEATFSSFSIRSSTIARHKLCLG